MQTGCAVGRFRWRICGLALVWGVTALAQATEMWIWLDEHNRRVLSDRPPPATVPPQRIVRSPSPRAVPADALADPPGQTPPAVALDVRADNCDRAQASLAQLQSGARLLMRDEHGQPIPMDAAMVRAERARLRQIIRDNCRQ